MSKGRNGSTRRWRAIRAAVLLRDGGRCRLRLPGTWRVRGGGVRQCLGYATEAHHVHGLSRCTGCSVNDPSHLIASCKPCNLRVGDPGRVSAARNARAHVVTQW